MAVSPELSNYVQAHRAAGANDEVLQAELLKVGWDQATVSEALGGITSPSQSTAAPVITQPVATFTPTSTTNTFILTPADASWSWGAFGLTWIWGINNKVWISLLALLSIIPAVGTAATFAFGIYLGINGRRLAFENRKFQSIEQFREVQKKWDIWGIISFLGGILLTAVLTTIVVYQLSQLRGGSNLDSTPSVTTQLNSQLNKERAETAGGNWAADMQVYLDFYKRVEGHYPAELSQIVDVSDSFPGAPITFYAPNLDGESLDYSYQPFDTSPLSRGPMNYRLNVTLPDDGCAGNGNVFTMYGSGESYCDELDPYFEDVTEGSEPTPTAKPI